MIFFYFQEYFNYHFCAAWDDRWTHVSPKQTLGPHYPRCHYYHWTHITKIEAAAAAAKSLQSCLTLCDPIDGSPPCSPVPGILQARTLEWVAISFSKAWKWKMRVKSLSRVQLLATPWTAAHQAPLSMGFSRQEYWSGVPLPSPFLWERDTLKVLSQNRITTAKLWQPILVEWINE